MAPVLARALIAIVGLGLLWAGIQYDVHNAIGRALMAPLANKAPSG
jgi:hypothetical protein